MGLFRNPEDRISPDNQERATIHFAANFFQIDRNVGVISRTGITGIVSAADLKSSEALNELCRTTRIANVVVAYRNFSFSLDSVNFTEVTTDTASRDSDTSKSYKFTARDIRLETISLT